jgi:hypothetical protein
MPLGNGRYHTQVGNGGSLIEGLRVPATFDSETTNIPGGLRQREPDLQSDLIALHLAILDRTAHLRDCEPAEISMFRRPC